MLGANVAKYSSEKLHENVIDSENFKKGEYKDALRKGFMKIDSDLRQGDDLKTKNKHRRACILICKKLDPNYEHETSGCTAIVALLTKDNTLYVVCHC